MIAVRCALEPISIAPQVCFHSSRSSSSSASWIVRPRMVAAVHLSTETMEQEEEEESVAMSLISDDVAAALVPRALTWSSLHGLVMGDKAVENSGVVPGVGIVQAPISLLPCPFPKGLYEQAIELAPYFNLLVDSVSEDGDFLQETLSLTRKVDPFTDNLLRIHSKIRDEGVEQKIKLGMHRSDYMRDMATEHLLQVELNTISSSFAGLGSLVSQLHRYLIGSIDQPHQLEANRVPENNVANGFADVLGLAWKEFGNASAAVLFVVQPVERNMYDQHWLALKLQQLHGVKAVRKTLSEIYAEATILDDGTLFIGEQTVSVIYFRAGYSPDDYPTENEWKARLLLERSSAIKCPSISYHLAGTKKIQQQLAKPDVLERFVKDADIAEKMRNCFAGLWSLQENGSLDIINKAINNPDSFVLKPQREGGGNNTYGDDVRSKLTELLNSGGDGLAAYILMQRIFPPTYRSYLVRGGVWSGENTISELGIFGAFLRSDERVIVNEASGYLMRTKVSHSNEGGVATGFAVLDSLYLY